MTRADLAALVARVKSGEMTDTLKRDLTVFFYQNGHIGGVNYDPDLWIIRNGGEPNDRMAPWNAIGTAPTEPAARLAALLRAMMETCDE
jgi:hypothetical protein